MTKKQKRQLAVYILVFLLVLINLFMTQCAKKEKISVIEEQEKEQIEYCYAHFLNVGQGDCTLIETHDGKYALIDASTQEAAPIILSYLTNEGVKELEYVIFTHPHEDHIGCGDEIIENFKVNNIYMTDKIETTACYEKLIESIAKSKQINGTKVLRPKTSEKFYLGDIEFLVLSDGSEYEDTNNSSICLRVEYGKTTFIFTGDAEKPVERDILNQNFDLEAEIYKCAHHGSSTSNSEEFLDAIDPRLAIISCGLDNDYGHPHVEVISSLYKRDVTTLRTYEEGHIVISFTEESYIIPKL